MGVISLLKVEWLDHRAVRCRAVLSAFGGRLTDHQRLEIIWVRRGKRMRIDRFVPEFLLVLEYLAQKCKG